MHGCLMVDQMVLLDEPYCYYVQIAAAAFAVVVADAAVVEYGSDENPSKVLESLGFVAVPFLDPRLACF